MSCKGPARDVGKERFWRKSIDQQQRSGLSIREFCRQHGLTEPSFYAWRGELKRRRTARAEKSRANAATSNRGNGNRTNADGGRTRFASVRLVPDNAATLNMATALQFAAIELALPNGVMVRMPANTEPTAVAALLNAWEQGRC